MVPQLGLYQKYGRVGYMEGIDDNTLQDSNLVQEEHLG
jgi:hypothetical protein